MFGARRRADELEVELARTQALLAQVGGLDELQRGQRRHSAEQQLATTLREEQATRARIAALHGELARLDAELVETRAEQLLQATGVYEYVHPLDSAVAYKQRLTQLRADIKTSVTGRQAVTGSQCRRPTSATGWRMSAGPGSVVFWDRIRRCALTGKRQDFDFRAVTQVGPDAAAHGPARPGVRTHPVNPRPPLSDEPGQALIVRIRQR